MKVINKEKYLNNVEEKLVEAGKRLDALRHDRSPNSSESGHEAIRENVEREIIIQENVVKGLEQFKEFLKLSTEKTRVEEGAQFTVKFDSGEVIDDAIFAPLTVALEKVQIITRKSPLGEAVYGKKEEDVFSYQVGEQVVSGRITAVK
ncbi:MAG: GreA/GreB family elongation factor [Candidatus Daviesbacteria bacterium]|nr:GreA/GreB family elongation factor [Candidatus Daviesbacteria bacterium]